MLCLVDFELGTLIHIDEKTLGRSVVQGQGHSGKQLLQHMNEQGSTSLTHQ